MTKKTICIILIFFLLLMLFLPGCESDKQEPGPPVETAPLFITDPELLISFVNKKLGPGSWLWDSSTNTNFVIFRGMGRTLKDLRHEQKWNDLLLVVKKDGTIKRYDLVNAEGTTNPFKIEPDFLNSIDPVQNTYTTGALEEGRYRFVIANDNFPWENPLDTFSLILYGSLDFQPRGENLSQRVEGMRTDGAKKMDLIRLHTTRIAEEYIYNGSTGCITIHRDDWGDQEKGAEFNKGKLREIVSSLYKSSKDSPAHGYIYLFGRWEDGITENVKPGIAAPFSAPLFENDYNGAVLLAKNMYNDWAAHTEIPLYLQEKHNLHKLPFLEAHPLFDRDTRKAMGAFQTYYSALLGKKDNSADLFTLQKLIEEFVLIDSYYGPFSRPLRPGMSGPDVLALQKLYNSWAKKEGLKRIKKSSVYDEPTGKAIAAFQEAECGWYRYQKGSAGSLTQRMLYVQSFPVDMFPMELKLRMYLKTKFAGQK